MTTSKVTTVQLKCKGETPSSRHREVLADFLEERLRRLVLRLKLLKAEVDEGDAESTRP